MAGGHYIALSGMRTRLDELDRLASDIANVGTAGYKAERAGTANAPRPVFDAALADGHRRHDRRAPARRASRRDRAHRPRPRRRDRRTGFFVVDTPAGPRYTRNGHLTRQRRRDARRPATARVVHGDGRSRSSSATGKVDIDDDGTVSADGVVAGKLAVVDFADPGVLVRESGALLRADNAAATAIEAPVVRTGALEQSNVSVVDRVAELTNVSRSFEALQKAVSVLMNDVDGRANRVAGPPLDTVRRRSRQMIRALYTAASGMNAQQTNIDNVAHNLANVNTTGFKKSHVEFEDLVYQQIRAPGAPTVDHGEAPIGLEMGLGTRAVATSRDFSAGNLRSTSGPLDLAIEGDGFFQITLPDGTTGYTRAGTLHRDAQGLVVTAEGYALEPQITIPEPTRRRSRSRRTASSRRRFPARAPRSSSARSSWRRSRTRPG